MFNTKSGAVLGIVAFIGCLLLMGGLIVHGNNIMHTVNTQDITVEESKGDCSFDLNSTGDRTTITPIDSKGLPTSITNVLHGDICVATKSAIQLGSNGRVASKVSCLEYRISEPCTHHSTLERNEVCLIVMNLGGSTEIAFSEEDKRAIERIWLKYLDKVNSSRSNLLEGYDDVKAEISNYADVVVITNFGKVI